MEMEAIELARWTRFAAKGGIGKCTAMEDCVAENAGDLMFLKGDEITVLMQLSTPPDTYLGFCEGVVGQFQGANVRFHSRLKKPVMAKRSSTTAGNVLNNHPLNNATSRAKSPTRTRISIDEQVAATLVLPPSSPESMMGVTRTRFSMGTGSRRSSAGQERSDGEYTSSRGASPAISSPLARGRTTPPPPMLHSSPKAISRSSLASSKHTSVLSSYSQATEYEEEPSFSRADISSDTVIQGSMEGPQTIAKPFSPPSPPATSISFSSPPPPTTKSFPSAPPTTTKSFSPSPPTTTKSFSPSPPMSTNIPLAPISTTQAIPQPSLPSSFSALSTSSLYASSSGSMPTPSTSSTLHSSLPSSSSSAATAKTPITLDVETPSSPDAAIASAASSHFDNSRFSLALSEDGEVGIGLSLLQGLADTDAWGSDSDLDGDSEEGHTRTTMTPKRKGSNRSTRSRSSLRRKESSKKSNNARFSAISEGSVYSSEDGLNYADTETGHSQSNHSQSHVRMQASLDLEEDLTRTRAAFAHIQHVVDVEDDVESPVLGHLDEEISSSTTTTTTSGKQLGERMMTFPPVAPLSPSRGRFTSTSSASTNPNAGDESFASTYEFPTPPTHTHRVSLSTLNSNSNPNSPSSIYTTFNQHHYPPPPPPPPPSSPPSSILNPDINPAERTRRPSTVSSASTDNWDGDIYDDYRYSRFSMGGRSIASASNSRVSVGSRRDLGGGSSIAGSGAGEWPPEGLVNAYTGDGNGLAGGGSGGVNPLRQSVDQTSASGQGPIRPIVVRTRTRSNTNASLGPIPVPTSPPPQGALPPTPGQLPVALSTTSSPPRNAHRHSPPEYASLPARAPSTAGSASTGNSPKVGERTLSMGGHRPTDSESSGSVYSAQHSGRVDDVFPLSTTTTSDKPSEPLISTTSFNDSASNPAPTSTRPAPLKLASSNHKSPIPPSSSENFASSIRSPLLHTRWGSTLSSPSSAPAPQSQFALSTSSSHSYPLSASAAPSATTMTAMTATSSPGTYSYSGSPPSTGGRVIGKEMSAIFGLDVPNNMAVSGQVRKESGDVDSRRGLKAQSYEDVTALVREDEDEGVFGRKEDAGMEEERDRKQMVDEPTLILGDEALRESPSTVSSPEPELEMKSRLAPLVVMNRTPSPAMGPVLEEEDEEEEEAEEMEREKEKLRKEAAGLSSSTSTLTPAPTALSSSPAPPPIVASPDLMPSVPGAIPRPSHLRPTLSDIRPTGERQSLFLPHPNAPKATPTNLSPGPSIATQAQTQPPLARQEPQRVRGSAMQAIHMILSGQAPVGPRGRPTFYGIVSSDLSAAMGPVLIQFTVTPPPATAPPPGSVPTPNQSPIPRVAVTSTPPPPLSRITPPPPRMSPTPPVIAAPVPRPAVRRVGSMASLDVSSAKVDVTQTPGTGAGEGTATGGVIPRANFFPKAPGARPRSRSFSGFQSSVTEVPLPVQGSAQSSVPSATQVKRSLSPIVGSPISPTTSAGKSEMNQLPSRATSFLPRQETPSVAARPRPPNSPLAQSFSAPYQQEPPSSSVPPSPTTSTTMSPPPSRLRPTPSRSTLSEAPISRSTIVSRSTLDSTPSPQPRQPTPEPKSRPSVDTDAVSITSSRSNVISPIPSLGRQSSMRTKLSLPNLRRTTSKQDESSPLSPISPSGESVQIKDTDFELVRPTFTSSHFQGPRSSEDSGVMGRDMSVDARLDKNFLSTDKRSPGTDSGMFSRSPTIASDPGSPGPYQPSKPAGTGTDSETTSSASMDAHRNRELKWMGVLGSLLPSQSRKNKKVKKLIFDGVPASVRYLVWSMLTDGKARCVPGVYAQLGSRARIAVLGDIEKDVKRCFKDHPQLLSTQGPVLSLLQAYLTMVPDVLYVTGLTLIAGNLLLHAPEEDAFWIFVSLMDTHIRPYFSSTPTQVDVDATLFARCMESVEPAMARKLLGEYKLSPASICRPLFTSLFVGSLPPDYLNRVWDVFLFEGVTFLFRVALVLISCSARSVVDARTPDAALRAVLRPPPELLPPSPEAFITSALAVKIKDDDIRKQRVKLEAQAKRQTMVTRNVAGAGAISLPRS